MIRSFLDIQPATDSTVNIIESISFTNNIIKNQIWYRGDASELHQLYNQIDDGYVSKSRFWKAAPAKEDIRKLHSGLPALIVDTLAYIVKSDMNNIEFSGQKNDSWESIKEEIDFTQLVGKAVLGALISGDGAFKISVDSDISDYPLVDFYSADRVELEYNHGRVTGIVFTSVYSMGKKQYKFCEIHKKNKVSYKLYDGKKEVSLSTIDELKDLKPVSFAGDYMMAIPFKIFDSQKYTGRGKSIFDTKTDSFDAHDEVISQWVDALRAGRVQRYIPEDFVPRNPVTGELELPSAFGASYIGLGGGIPTEGKIEKIEMLQPEIRYEAFLSSYTATLNMCLQGLISPATLGIDVGKMSSADAQREKKDVTGYTRNSITNALEKTLPELVNAILKTYDNMQSNIPADYGITVSFGEYGAPDFDSKVESISKAAISGIMSVEAQVEELWGNSKDEKWKGEEIERLKSEKGLEDVNQPSPSEELVEIEP